MGDETMVRRVLSLSVVSGALAVACGNSSGDDDSRSGGSAGMSAAAGSAGVGGAGTGGAPGAASGGKAGAGAGAAGLAGGGGAPDVGTFTGLTGLQHQISMASGRICVADTTGVVTCDSTFNRPPKTPFASFGVGQDISGQSGCGLTATGEVSCWGGDVGAPPPGPYTALAVGDSNACGIRPNGSITCFGEDDSLNEPPPGQFTDVSVEEERACALAVDGHVECWGPRSSSQDTRLEGSFKQVAVGSSARCTLDMAGAIACLPARETSGTFERLAVTSSHVCGLRADGTVACFGTDETARLAPLPGPFTDIASYSSGICGRKADGTAECWGASYGDGASTLACEPSNTSLMGTLDGTAFSLEGSSSRQVTFDTPAGFRWTFRTSSTELDTFGVIVLDGAEELQGAPETALKDGQTVNVERVLMQVGASEASAGEFYCSATGSSAELNVDELAVTFSNMHSLGGCPGTPVDGELTACPNCAAALGGTADGNTFDLRSDQGSNIGAQGGVTALYLEDTSYVVYEKAEDGTVPWGIVVTNPASPGGFAVYCAGAGSTWTVSESGTSTNSIFKGLSKLDACPTDTSTDALAGCIR